MNKKFSSIFQFYFNQATCVCGYNIDSQRVGLYTHSRSTQNLISFLNL